MAIYDYEDTSENKDTDVISLLDNTVENTDDEIITLEPSDNAVEETPKKPKTTKKKTVIKKTEVQPQPVVGFGKIPENPLGAPSASYAITSEKQPVKPKQKAIPVKEPSLWDNMTDFAKNLFPDSEEDNNGKLVHYNQTSIKTQQQNFKQDSKDAMNATGKFEFLKDYKPEDRALFVSKLVPKTNYTEKKYNQETNKYEITPKQEAVDYVKSDINVKDFKTQDQLNQAIALNVKKLASQDGAFEFEQNFAKAKAAPLIKQKAAEIQKKYKLTSPTEVAKATKELQDFAAKTTTDFLINSEGFQNLNKQFTEIENTANEDLARSFGRSKDFTLSNIDVVKNVGKSLQKGNIITKGIGKAIEAGTSFYEGATKGFENIAQSTKQSLVSANHNSVANLNNTYSAIKDKPDNAPIDKSFAYEWENNNFGTYDSKEQNIPATYGEAKSRLKKYLDKTNTLINERVQNIEERKRYIGLFDQADLKDGIQIKDIFGLVGEQVPNIGLTTVGAATGNPYIMGLSAANMFTQTYGPEYYSAIETGLKEDLGREPNQKEIAKAIGEGKYADRGEAAAWSALSAATEYASELNVIKNTGKALNLGNDTKNVLGSLFRGEIKNFGKSAIQSGKQITSSALGEYLTESTQQAIDQVSMGTQLHNDTTKYLNLKEINEAGFQGGLIGAVFPFVGAVKTQTAIELKAAATKVATSFDLSSKNAANLVQVDNFFKAATNNIEERFKVGDITEEQKQSELETLGTIRSSGSKIPSNFSEAAKKESLDLILEKANIEKETEGKDKELIGPQLERLKEINADLADIAIQEKTRGLIDLDVEKTKKLVKDFGIEEDVEVPLLNTANDVIDYLTKNTDLTENEIDRYSESLGTFVPLKNGKQALVINKEEAAMQQVVTTGQHEFLHQVLYKAIQNNTGLQEKIGSDLYNHIENYIGKELLNNTEFKERYDQYKSDYEKIQKANDEKLKTQKERFENGEISKVKYDAFVEFLNNNSAKAKGNYLEEVLPLLSESLSRGDIAYNETFFTKLGDIIRQIFQAFGLKKISFDNGQDVFDFVRDYNKSFKKGSFNKAFKGLATKGEFKGSIQTTNKTVNESVKQSQINPKVDQFKQDLKDLEEEYDEGYADMSEEEYTSKKANIESKIKAAEKLVVKEPAKEEKVKEIKEVEDADEEDVKKIIKEEKGNLPSAKVQEIYTTKGLAGAADIIKLFKPITKRIVDKRRDAPGFDRELLTDEIETGVGGILDLITKYKPESGVPLAAYINKYLPVRAIATSRRILGEQFTKDASEEVGLMATETADQNMTERVAEKPKYKNVLEAKVFEPGVLKTMTDKILVVLRTLKSRIDAPVTLNKTVTPIIGEIRDEVGKLLDIDIKTAMGGKKDDQLKNFLLKHKRYILENMTTTWLMGKDGQGGMPIAIQKQIDGKWVNYPNWVGQKIDREKTTTDQAGRTSGHELVRRLPNVANNISDEDFLAQVLGSDGNPLRGRKESLAKAMAEESAFDIINNDFENDGPILEAFKTNQERQGVEIAENIITDFARQTERGNVKQSKAFNKLSDKQRELFNKNINVLSNQLNPFLTNVNKNLSIIGAFNRTFDNLLIDGKKAFSYQEIKGLVDDFLPWLRQMQAIDKSNALFLEDENFDFNKFLKNITEVNEEVGLEPLEMPGIEQKLFTAANVNSARETSRAMINHWNNTLGPEETMKICFYLIGTFASNSHLGNLIGLNVDKNGIAFETNEKGRKSGQITKSSDDYWNNIVFPSFTNLSHKEKVALKEKVRLETLPLRKKDSASESYADKAWDLRRSQAEYYQKIVQKIFEFYFDKNNNISNTDKAIMVKQMGSNMQSALKKSAILTYEFVKNKKDENISAIRYEHTRPANKVTGEITKAYLQANGKPSENTIKAIWDTFKVSLIPVTMDKNFQPIFLEDKMPPGWKPGDPLLYRYYNYATFGKPNMYAVKNVFTGKVIGEKFVEASNALREDLENYDKIESILSSNIKESKKMPKDRLSPRFNKIIEQVKGTEDFKVFSDIGARRRGANKNRFDFYVPPSAADFELLLYKFMGKGPQGEKHKEFLDKALLIPYTNGVTLMDSARQSIKREYKKLLDTFPDVKNDLEKLIPDGDFTYDQAIRVAMWSEGGKEIPGISEKDKIKLTKLVEEDEELNAFKDGLTVMGRQGIGWVEPLEYWDSNTIISDLHNITEGDGRKKFLGEFIENVEEIFGKFKGGKIEGPNMNKIEAVYGANVREALDDIIYRMISGKNKGFNKDRETSAWSNWVNGSTGTIMFLNTRSAALQLIGAVNFLNFRDNNPYAAAKAFANQPQYWKDFAHIWNSNKMKERRGGLKEDVAAAEIANAASGSKNKVNAVVSYLLKIGYTPTQLADSFAIASGGAPFYRNRIKSYQSEYEGLDANGNLKRKYTDEQAEKLAWNDFTKVSDETQQSGDPKDISKQQASPAGRLLLTFQNTAMQQSRIVKKAILDLKNRRGDDKTNVSKIIYYLTVQNLMFAALQQGLFATFFDDEDDDKDKKKKKTGKEQALSIADDVLDTILRGTGFGGGITATLKNMVIKYNEEKEKKYKADYAKVVLEGANISPPIGSKLKKLYSGFQQTKYDKDLIEKRGWGIMQNGRVHLGPNYSVYGKLSETVTNVPFDRIVNKIENVSQAMNTQNEAWQRVMLGMGWSPYSVGLERNAEDLKIREEAANERKEQGKIKAKEKRDITKDSILNLPEDEYKKYVLKKKAEKESKKDSIANLSAEDKQKYIKDQIKTKELREKEKQILKQAKADSIADLSPSEKANYDRQVAIKKAIEKKESHEKYVAKKKALNDSLAKLSPKEIEKYKADKKAERHQYYLDHKDKYAKTRKTKKAKKAAEIEIL